MQGQMLDARDAELEILRHDAAVQQQEIERLQVHAGAQQSRVDYLEGSNSQLCIELQSSNAHYAELLANWQQVSLLSSAPCASGGVLCCPYACMYCSALPNL